MAVGSHSSEQGALLSSFPFLSSAEFKAACQAFLDRVHVAGISTVGWSSIQYQVTGPILKISQNIAIGCNSLLEEAWLWAPDSENAQDSQLEAWEEDPDALIRTHKISERLQVEYNIFVSPTYQVPVLYFVPWRADKPLGIDGVYEYLVPDQYKMNIRGVGIMGGISSGYHPVSGTPAFFVHPCNTADAMRDIASGHDITPETYLIVWLGLIGNSVRLQLPSELFAIAGIPEFSK